MKGVRSSTDGALTPALAVTTKLRNSKDRKFQTAARLVPKAAIKQGQWSHLSLNNFLMVSGASTKLEYLGHAVNHAST